MKKSRLKTTAPSLNPPKSTTSNKQSETSKALGRCAYFDDTRSTLTTPQPNPLSKRRRATLRLRHKTAFNRHSRIRRPQLRQIHQRRIHQRNNPPSPLPHGKPRRPHPRNTPDRGGTSQSLRSTMQPLRRSNQQPKEPSNRLRHNLPKETRHRRQETHRGGILNG